MPTQQQKLRTTLIQFYSQPVAQVSIELFLTLGLITLFALFAIRPTLLTMADLIQEIEDKEQLDSQLQQKSAALATAQTVYLSNEEKLSLLDQAIPSTPEFEQSLKIIEKIASDNQVVITSIRVDEIPEEETGDIPFDQKQRVDVPIQVTVTADYPIIRQFVEDIQNNRRSLSVDTITFRLQENRSRTRLEATLTINMQYFGKK